VYKCQRGTWGEEQGKRLLLETPVLTWDHLYPAEERLRQIVLSELAEGRRVMIYIEQNDLRSMPRRLAWVLKDLPTWTLSNRIKSEDRQQAILDAVHHLRKTVLFVPYKKVNEGLNLQSAIDTIIWYEMAMNLFLLDQASRRAWRLGKKEEVRIYYLVYAGTAGHSKLRKLGNQSGAAAAFAGEVARGALIEQAGADKTTLAKLSAFLDEHQETEEDEEEDLFTSLRYSSEEAEALKAAFARRAQEEREALKNGRQWLGGITDHLPERLPAFFEGNRPSVWKQTPKPSSVLNALALQTSVVQERTVVEAEMAPSVPPSQTSPTPMTPSTPEAERVASSPAPQGEALPIRPASKTAHTVLAAETQEKRASGSGKKVTPSTSLTPEKLLFGNEQHIALLRPKRQRRRQATGMKHPKRQSPVEVHTIAAVSQMEQEATEPPQVVALSLWVGQEESDTKVALRSAKASVTPPEVIEQSSLW
jgi:hypothetical protein